MGHTHAGVIASLPPSLQKNNHPKMLRQFSLLAWYLQGCGHRRSAHLLAHQTPTPNQQPLPFPTLTTNPGSQVCFGTDTHIQVRESLFRVSLQGRPTTSTPGALCWPQDFNRRPSDRGHILTTRGCTLCIIWMLSVWNTNQMMNNLS